MPVFPSESVTPINEATRRNAAIDMQEVTSVIPPPSTGGVASVDFTIGDEPPWRNNAAPLQGSTERREGVGLGDGLNRPSLDRAHDSSPACRAATSAFCNAAIRSGRSRTLQQIPALVGMRSAPPFRGSAQIRMLRRSWPLNSESPTRISSSLLFSMVAISL